MTMLTIEQIAANTSTSIKTIRREVAAGRLKSTRQNNRYYIHNSDFERWKNTSVAENTPNFEPLNNLCADSVNWLDISGDMNAVNGWNNSDDIENFNFIDLFAGAGGLSCGLVMAGLCPVGSVEIMPSAVETYRRNFSKINVLDDTMETRDIKDNAVKQELIDSVKNKHIHLISGGFPCQGFSLAGNRIVDDERNSLYREMLSIVKVVKPDFVLMENVEGLRSMLGGQVEKQIISDYKEIGYEINVTVLNAADYGVPQIRKRVIFIGNRIGAINVHPMPMFKPSEYKTVKDGIGRFVAIPENREINHIFTRHSEDIIKRLKQLPEGSSLYDNYSDAWKRVYWEQPSITVKENHGGVNVHPLFPRVMTPRELAALQSFPDDFIFEGSKKWQLVQIGNAVPPLLGKAIGLAIKKSLKGETQNITRQSTLHKFEQLSLFER